MLNCYYLYVYTTVLNCYYIYVCTVVLNCYLYVCRTVLNCYYLYAFMSASVLQAYKFLALTKRIEVAALGHKMWQFINCFLQSYMLFIFLFTLVNLTNNFFKNILLGALSALDNLITYVTLIKNFLGLVCHDSRIGAHPKLAVQCQKVCRRKNWLMQQCLTVERAGEEENTSGL